MRTMLFVAGHYQKGDSGLICRASAWRRRPRCSATATICSPASPITMSDRAGSVDEAQFLDESRSRLARIADRLNILVMCYGLRTDFQGKRFPLARAAGHRRRFARGAHHCRCGRATMVVRPAPTAVARQGEQVAIGRMS